MATRAKLLTVPDVLDAAQHPQRAVIDAMRAIIADAVPLATESVKWNAPSFATTEHFATFHLRAKTGVQLVLHLGAKSKPGVDMRLLLGEGDALLEWKGPDRALITIRDAEQLSAVQSSLSQLVRAWVAHLG
jgi:hypothetical protein